MAGKNAFAIPFTGLAEGEHEFEMPVTDRFFEVREFSELRKGNFEVQVTLNKHPRMLMFDFVIDGKAEVHCDLCNEPFYMPVHTEKQLIVKFSDRFEEESEDVILIPEAESEFDVGHYIYEYIATALPVRRIHPDGGCDPETLNKLEELKVSNKQGPQDTDPRWDKLKDLN